MPVKHIGFKSYCWSIGTTSYRTKEFNANIERQLALIEEFWKSRKNKEWNAITQAAYYKFMQANKFVKGEAGRPEKDAREKTSGLVNIGLLTADRKLTPAGLELLTISKIGDFSKDNELNIAKDSYIYLKQLLKMSVPIDFYTIRPFILLIHFISKLGFLSKDEYTYILPLCINEETTKKALLKIQDIRKNKSNVDSFIADIILSMKNYKEALKLLISKKTVNEDLITVIGMNRKSHTYDKPYYKLYKELFALCFNKKKNNLLNVYKSIGELQGKSKSLWKDFLFSSTSIRVIKNNPNNALKKIKLLNSITEKDFKIEFFKLLHLFKVKANLSDYLDLNRRYFKLTDIILFKDNLVKMDYICKFEISSV
ncbi:MAG: AlwI family type II restriction endonuclease [Endomicrobium sp.]|nr:AlwI family type II restriction endonuclease [Endomicrobium sp.]